MSGMQGSIETCVEECKQYLGMGDYEVRSWRGWHHHMTLCILDHFFLVRQQQALKKTPRA
jgi:SRSO17 transposase